MENNKIISCTNCGQQVRIPANKHIRFACPHCSTRFEYKDGEPFNAVEVMETVTPAPVPERDVTSYRTLALVLLICIVLGGIYWAASPNKPRQVADNIVPTTDTSSATIDTTNIIGTPVASESEIRDSVFEHLLEEFLKEASKELFKEMLEKIAEESEHGSWEKANEWYEKIVDAAKKTSKGKQLLKNNEAQLAKIKNDIVRQDPDKGSLPGSETDETGPEQSYATHSITNSTSYYLTIYYSGAQDKIVNIPPNGELVVKLIKGSYSIVASVNAPNVRNYYGSEIYKGYRYSSEFYIHTRSGGLFR